jgi:hypothetical protein
VLEVGAIKITSKATSFGNYQEKKAAIAFNAFEDDSPKHLTNLLHCD